MMSEDEVRQWYIMEKDRVSSIANPVQRRLESQVLWTLMTVLELDVGKEK